MKNHRKIRLASCILLTVFLILCFTGCDKIKDLISGSPEDPQCDHTPSDWIIDAEPTCSAQGAKHKECTVCGERLEDGLLDKLAHSPSDWIVDAEPTCSAQGAKHKECTVCGERLDSEAIPALGHSYAGGVCTTCGEAKGSDGLEFTSNGDGTCYVSGIGTCTDIKIIIPPVSPTGDTVTSIGYNAFSVCTGLTSVTIPNSVTSIGEGAFYYCTDLTSVAIPNSVTSIGNWAFAYCINLTSVTIPDSVTSIGNFAFSDCRGLTSVTIPDSVTSIDYDAFAYCTGLVSVTIGNGVTSIGDYAFYGCTGLTSITIDADNPAYKGIDGNLYTKDGKTLIQYAVGKSASTFIIPDTVESIGNLAFENCASLTSITIPDSVTSIGDEAFTSCTGLASVTIPSVKSIGEGAFLGCTGLTSVTIGNGVKSIGYGAFSDCTGLTSVTIGNGVKSIGYGAFWGCTNLTDVYYTGTEAEWSNITIGDYNDPLTSATRHYAEPDYAEGLEFTSNGDGTCYVSGIGTCTDTDIVIPHVSPTRDTVTGIGAYAFCWCTTLTSVTIPDSVTSIDEGAFYGCTSLTSITVDTNNPTYKSVGGHLYTKDGKTLVQYAIGNTATEFIIPDGVESIGALAFYDCPNLTSVTIPDSVTSIGEDAFSYCDNLTSVTIGDGVTSIGDYAFLDCTGLTSITVDTDNPAYKSVGGHLYTKDGKTLVQYAIGSTATEFIIPDGVESIGNYAFRYCTDLTSITIPNSVTSIGEDAFYKCTGLASVTIGNGVTSIGSSAFSGCTNLASVTIPDSVTSIGKSAFSDCIGLTSVTIPNSVTSIGSGAFDGCTGLEEIYFNAKSMADRSYNNYVFDSAGKNGDGIKVIIGKNVTKIPAYLFFTYDSSDSPKITIVEFEEGSVCENIGDYAFYYCTRLTSVTIGNGVTSIGNSAFAYCTGLTSVTIGNGVESIGSSAFAYCTGLTSVTIGNGVKSIGSYAFSSCAGLTEIYYTGSSVEWELIDINDYAIPSGVTIHYNS